MAVEEDKKDNAKVDAQPSGESLSNIRQIIKDDADFEAGDIAEITDIAGYDDDQIEDLSKFNKVKRLPFVKRKHAFKLEDIDSEDISYKNPILLKKFVSDHGKILSPRLTLVRRKQQRKLREQIKIARIMNLMSFVKR